ncbi:discoidin domain-containing protein [Paenibacillus sp. SAF-054]|uniref:discoidin domain-containing protein n=1 Tax=unclassified Paenibacillus TaxID=185978 RepID=UPI003F7D156B
MPQPLPSGLKRFEPSDIVRRDAQNENIEAMDALFHASDGHRHTGKAGDAPQIGQEGLSDGAVTTEKLKENGVTSEKIASNSVTSAKIADHAVTAAKISAGAVTSDKIATSAVNTEKLAANSVTAEKIAASAIIADKLAAGSVGTEKLANSAVTTAKMAATAVTGEKIADAAVTSGKLADGSVNGDKLAINSINRRHLHSGQLSTNIAKYKRVFVTGGEVTGLPTSPYQDYGASRNGWMLYASYAPLPQTITIYLEREYRDLEGICFQTRADAYPAEFKVEISLNGDVWNTVYTYANQELESEFQNHFFDQPVNATHVRITVTKASDPLANVFLSRIGVYAANDYGFEQEALGDVSTWGLTARLQGLLIIPQGTVGDHGLQNGGMVSFSDKILIMNPAAGTYFYIQSGSYTLPDWGYLYVDIPLPYSHRETVTPQIKVWDHNLEKPRLYDHPDRLILAQRINGTVYFNSALNTNLINSLRMSNGYLEYNDGTEWKGVGIKSVQRGWVDRMTSRNLSVNIKKVNPAKSFVNISYCGRNEWHDWTSGTNVIHVTDGNVYAALNDTGSSVTFAAETSYSFYQAISWEVIEYA